MLNPNQPQKKGFRAFAERGKERRLADAIGDVAAALSDATEPVTAPVTVVPENQPKLVV